MQSILSPSLPQENLFGLQVDVGDFLRIKSCVLYTEHENSEKPLINIEVVAHVTRPELRSSEVGAHFPFFQTTENAFRVIASPRNGQCLELLQYDLKLKLT